MTLRDRIGGNHLRGSIYGSTFRRTLAACLRLPLGLRVASPGKLERDSELALTEWMIDHLSVAVHAFPDRDALKSLEERVLERLNPPLNLEGMSATPVRAQLSALRRTLAESPSGAVRLGTRCETEAAPPRTLTGEKRPVACVRTTPTLHEELVAILRQRGRGWMTTEELAAAVNSRGQYVKRDRGLDPGVVVSSGRQG
jgi:hypothetical protein